VAVVNQAAARQFFGGETEAVGRRFRFGTGQDNPWTEVVGVVGDARNRGLDLPPAPEIWLSLEQFPSWWNQLFVLVRSGLPAASLLPSIRGIVRDMDPLQPLYLVRTMEQVQSEAAMPRRVPALLVSIFAGFALLLAAVGVYGVVSYGVSQRAAEIGVRLALGAGAAQVRRMVVRQALLPVAAGAAAGLAIAVALGTVMSRVLFEVRAWDPLALGGVIVTLGLAAAAASWFPARRASRISPAKVLGTS
jgi:hypothetical protein